MNLGPSDTIDPSNATLLTNFKYCREDKNFYHFDVKEGMWAKCHSTESVFRIHKLRLDPYKKNDMLGEIEANHWVKFVGEIAGFGCGEKNIEGKGKILIPEGCKLPEPRKGDFTFITEYLEQLLGKEQAEYFNCWLATARENIRQKMRRPLPVLCLVGPVDSGKSLLIEVITRALGNRVADAYKFLTEASNFNHEIIGSEVLMIDDKPVPKSPAAREHFGSMIKNQLFAPAVLWEGKGVNGVTVKPIQVIVIACNTNKIKLLPVITDDLTDKITLLKVTKANLRGLGRNEISVKIMRALPGYLQSILTLSNEIPEKFFNRRTHTKAIHHPEIMALLQEDSPEGQLLSLVNLDDGIQNNLDDGSPIPSRVPALSEDHFLNPSNDIDEYHREWMKKQNPVGIGKLLHNLASDPTCPYLFTFGTGRKRTIRIEKRKA